MIRRLAAKILNIAAVKFLPADLFDGGEDDIFPPRMPAEYAALATAREFLYDSQVADYEVICTVLGLPPISDEVSEMERKASDARTSRVEHLFPLLHSYAHTMTSGAIGLMMGHSGDNSGDVEKWRKLAQMTEPIVLATLIGAVSQMVDRSILNVEGGSK